MMLGCRLLLRGLPRKEELAPRRSSARLLGRGLKIRGALPLLLTLRPRCGEEAEFRGTPGVRGGDDDGRRGL